MAARVRNNSDINFGIMSAQVVCTHVRFRVAVGDAQPVIANVNDVTAAATEGLRIRVNTMSMKYNSGPFTDEHMLALIQSYWQGVPFEIDLMTSSTQVVPDSGYSQQSFSGWTFDTPAD